MSHECRLPGCSRRAAEGVDPHSSRFCSDPCEIKYDHLKADARERRADMEVRR